MPFADAMALVPLWLMADGGTIDPVRSIMPDADAMALVPLWRMADGETIVPVRSIMPGAHSMALVPLWLITAGEIIVPVRSITQAAIPTPDAKATNEAAIKATIIDLNMITSFSSMGLSTRLIAYSAHKQFTRSAYASAASAVQFPSGGKCCSNHVGSQVGGSLKFNPIFEWNHLFLLSCLA
jgi:hypothetical protein